MANWSPGAPPEVGQAWEHLNPNNGLRYSSSQDTAKPAVAIKRCIDARTVRSTGQSKDLPPPPPTATRNEQRAAVQATGLEWTGPLGVPGSGLQAPGLPPCSSTGLDFSTLQTHGDEGKRLGAPGEALAPDLPLPSQLLLDVPQTLENLVPRSQSNIGVRNRFCGAMDATALQGIQPMSEPGAASATSLDSMLKVRGLQLLHDMECADDRNLAVTNTAGLSMKMAFKAGSALGKQGLLGGPWDVVENTSSGARSRHTQAMTGHHWWMFKSTMVAELERETGNIPIDNSWLQMIRDEILPSDDEVHSLAAACPTLNRASAANRNNAVKAKRQGHHRSSEGAATVDWGLGSGPVTKKTGLQEVPETTNMQLEGDPVALNRGLEEDQVKTSGGLQGDPVKMGLEDDPGAGGQVKSEAEKKRRAGHYFDVHRADDEGYEWRRYSHKMLKGEETKRFYYCCTARDIHGCCARKIVDREASAPKGEASRDTVYREGSHNHPPLLRLAKTTGRCVLMPSRFRTGKLGTENLNVEGTCCDYVTDPPGPVAPVSPYQNFGLAPDSPFGEGLHQGAPNSFSSQNQRPEASHFAAGQKLHPSSPPDVGDAAEGKTEPALLHGSCGSYQPESRTSSTAKAASRPLCKVKQHDKEPVTVLPEDSWEALSKADSKLYLQAEGAEDPQQEASNTRLQQQHSNVAFGTGLRPQLQQATGLANYMGSGDLRQCLEGSDNCLGCGSLSSLHFNSPVFSESSELPVMESGSSRGSSYSQEHPDYVLAGTLERQPSLGLAELLEMTLHYCPAPGTPPEPQVPPLPRR